MQPLTLNLFPQPLCASWSCGLEKRLHLYEPPDSVAISRSEFAAFVFYELSQKPSGKECLAWFLEGSLRRVNPLRPLHGAPLAEAGSWLQPEPRAPDLAVA